MSLEEFLKENKPLIGKNHPIYNISQNKKDIKVYELPELTAENRLYGNEKYIKVENKNE